MEPEYCKMAREMLGVEELETVLDLRLSRIDELCRLKGGQLWSRQVVAMVIEQWEREMETQE